MFENIILGVHMLLAIILVVFVLIQQGKGADAGASFGAGASQTVFGSGGSGNFLTRTTGLLAALFFVTSFALAYVARQQAEGLESLGLDIPTVEQLESQQGPQENPVNGEEVPVQ